MRTVKQPHGSGMCAVCVAAMIANTDPAAVYEFLNDGRQYGDPIHDSELAMFILKHGWIMGRGWQFAKEDDPSDIVRLRDAVSVNMFIDDLREVPAVLSVRSETYPGLGHSVFWNGAVVRDPNPDVPDVTGLSRYALLQVFPLFNIGARFTKRLRCEEAEPPEFVKQWRNRANASSPEIPDDSEGE